MKQLLSSLLLLPVLAQAHPLADQRLIMEGASCAGLEFIGEDQLRLHDELQCSRGGEASLEARIRVLPGGALLAVETAPATPPNRPPRSWIYLIDRHDPPRVTLREPWTGWGALADETIAYRIAPTDPAIYRIDAMTMGDIACYIRYRDERGATHEEMADFTLCEREAGLTGRQARFVYQRTNVAAASCEGDPACRDYQTVNLIVDAQPVP